VLTDIWFPGWTCTVDEQPAEVQRADFLFRAVAVPAGKHDVIFTFAPASYRWGKYLSQFTLAAVCLCVLLTFLMTRTTTGRPARNSLAG